VEAPDLEAWETALRAAVLACGAKVLLAAARTEPDTALMASEGNRL